MTPAQAELTERLRALLADEPVMREVSMFGGRSFMVNERMIVSALKNGGLLVRVDGERHEEFLGFAEATQAEMGPGRDMGPGWIEVDADAIDDDERLAFWIGIAMEPGRAVTRGRRRGAPSSSMRDDRPDPPAALVGRGTHPGHT